MIEQGDGGDFVFVGGDIASDDTFFTAVYISLFGGDAFYNALVKNPTNKEFEESLNCVITADNLKTIETKANAALAWMVSSGFASEILTSAYNSIGKIINIDITITEPDGVSRTFSLIWDNTNLSLKQFKEV